MNSFNSLLISAVKNKKSHLCIGLDITPEGISNKYASIDDLKLHTKKIISATEDLAVAFKPNLGFYERWGSEGFKWLEETMSLFAEETLVIGDAKRGDIGNTATKYAEAIFDSLGADAITVAPYMGADSVTPFTDRKDKWTILLALTSNPGADDFEFHGDTPLFERVLTKAQEWGTTDNLMFVVGATRPEMLSRVRELAPDSFLLVPGVGAQGGTIEEVARFGLNSKCGLLVNSSRGIIYAGNSESTISASMAKTKAAAEDLAQKMSKTLQL